MPVILITNRPYCARYSFTEKIFFKIILYYNQEFNEFKLEFKRTQVHHHHMYMPKLQTVKQASQGQLLVSP